MSRVSKRMVPKRLEPKASADKIEALIKETCVAELIHWLLIFTAVPCFFIWRGAGGAVVFALYATGNLGFIVIQRYNRPRLIKLETRRKLKYLS